MSNARLRGLPPYQSACPVRDLGAANLPSSAARRSAGGTRFIGVYLARLLVEQGHEVTLLTRGKKAVTYKVCWPRSVA